MDDLLNVQVVEDLPWPWVIVNPTPTGPEIGLPDGRVFKVVGWDQEGMPAKVVEVEGELLRED